MTKPLQPASPDKRWVLAPSLDSYLRWCAESGLDAQDRVHVRFVTTPSSLTHLRDADFVLLPNWETNRSYQPLTKTKAMLAHCGKAPR